MVLKIKNSMDDDEHLPAILISPENSKNKFFMPDASVLVSQRKEALQNDELIETYRKEFVTDESESNQSSDGEISSFLKELKLNKCNNFIRSENPGIDLLMVDLSVLFGCLNDKERVFATSNLTRILCLNGDFFTTALDLFIDMIESFVSDASKLKYDEILCLLLILCSIILDKKCRPVADTYKISNIIHQMLGEFSLEHHSLASNFTQALLSSFKHFHNRLYLVESILILDKVSWKSFNTDPSQFSAKIAQSLTVHTLSELLGNETYNYSHFPRTVFDVKELLLRGKKRKSLQTYEQYGVLKFLNILFDFLPDEYNSTEDRNAAAEAKRQIITIISSWNRSQEKSSGDVFQMKVLTVRTKLLWEDNLKESNQDDTEDSSWD